MVVLLFGGVYVFENPFKEKIEQLVNGNIEEIKVNREEMMMFREAWIERADRKNIIGEAAHGGNITYRYQNPES